jgi:hypothetical protein
VMRGSLQGLEGILVRKKNQFRLVLSVDMLAKSVAVEIDATDVEPVTKRVQEDQYPGVFASPAIVAASHSPVSPVGLRVN